MNLWHDVPAGEKAPQEFNVLIEVPKGSHNKYEIDKETGLIALDRANYSAAAYPCEYGFVPQTYADDGDAFDILLLSTYPLDVGVLVHARPVAIMHMIDSGDADDKIIAVPSSDRRWDDVQDLADLNKHTLRELKHFFETYKVLKSDDPEKYKVVISGFDDKAAAMQALERSMAAYKEKFPKQ